MQILYKKKIPAYTVLKKKSPKKSDFFWKFFLKKLFFSYLQTEETYGCGNTVRLINSEIVSYAAYWPTAYQRG